MFYTSEIAIGENLLKTKSLFYANTLGLKIITK